MPQLNGSAWNEDAHVEDLFRKPSDTALRTRTSSDVKSSAPTDGETPPVSPKSTDLKSEPSSSLLRKRQLRKSASIGSLQSIVTATGRSLHGGGPFSPTFMRDEDDDMESVCPDKSMSLHAVLFGEGRSWSQFISYAQYYVGKVLVSFAFEMLIGTIIAINAFNIGWDLSCRVQHIESEWTTTVEHICLAMYTVELLMRFFSMGCRCLRDYWVRFDLFLVVIGVLTQWVLPLFGSISELGPLMVLRTARLLRLAKTVRLLIRFRELWMLVQGLLSSANTMLYTLLLLFVIIYIFACLVMELLFEHPLVSGPDRNEKFAFIVETHFSSLGDAMLTLIQFTSFDNVSEIYLPLSKNDWWLMIYFLSLMLVIGVVIMNLVTAVIVNSALEQTAQDKDLMKTLEARKKKRMVKEVREMFMRLDEDGSGSLSREELSLVTEQDKTLLVNITDVRDVLQIYDALDVAGVGELGIDEFCEGLWQIATSKTPLEIKRMQLQVNFIRDQVQDTREMQHRVGQICERLEKRTGTPRSASLQRNGVQEASSAPATPLTPAAKAWPPGELSAEDLAAAPPWAQAVFGAMLGELRELRCQVKGMQTAMTKVQVCL